VLSILPGPAIDGLFRDGVLTPGAGDTILIPAFKEHLGEFLTDEVVLVSVFVPEGIPLQVTATSRSVFD